MKLLLLLALVATSVLADTHTDNIQNLGETGVDCSNLPNADLPDVVFGHLEHALPCSCFSDLTLARAPVTLINANNNSVSEFETGIDGDGDLVVAFTIDARTFISDETVLAANTDQGKSWPLLSAAVTADATSGGGWSNSVAATAKFSALNDQPFLTPAQPYADPEIVFVDQTTGDDVTDVGCAYDSNKKYNLDGRTFQSFDGADANACGTFQLLGQLPVRDALRHCGFVKNPVAIGSGLAGDVVQGTSTTQSYTEYKGTLKVRTTQYKGNLRQQEVVYLAEAPFTISVLYPNLVHVSSGEVSIVGEVVLQAAITHQIWDTTTSDVDLNAFVGTSFPYAVASAATGSIGQPLTGTYRQNLTLNQDIYGTTGNYTAGTVCAIWELANGPNCGTNSGKSKYPLFVCDEDGDSTCSLGDFFKFGATDSDAWGSYSIPSTTADFAATLTGGSALPLSSCIQEQGANADLAACKQNVHLNLLPRSSWCDLNFDLSLTIGVVCRDDTTGAGNHASSWVPDGDEITAITGGNSGSLRVTAGGQQFECDSTTAPKKTVRLDFGIRSDNFCARVVATSSLTASMAIFQSDSSVANWGANCPGGTCATLTNGIADCGVGASTAAPLATRGAARDLCLQIPLAFGEVDIAAAADDKRVTQGQFVFGTTVYFETRVFSPDGVNLASSTITDLWITGSDLSTYPTTVNQGFQSNVTTGGAWRKRLRAAAGGGSSLVLQSYESVATVAEGSGTFGTRLAISDNIVTNSLITGAPDFFTAQSNPSFAGSNAAKLGKSWEGVSRGSLLMDEFTVHISDAAEEAAEGFKLWATITVTYKAAADQQTLGAEEVRSVKSVNGGDYERARLSAAPAISGRSVSATGGVTGPATTGSSSSSSTVLGVSATTVLAATVAVGAVVVAAGVGLFVVRRNRQNRRAAKRTSSTQELNDARQVQV